MDLGNLLQQSLVGFLVEQNKILEFVAGLALRPLLFSGLSLRIEQQLELCITELNAFRETEPGPSETKLGTKRHKRHIGTYCV